MNHNTGFCCCQIKNIKSDDSVSNFTKVEFFARFAYSCGGLFLLVRRNKAYSKRLQSLYGNIQCETVSTVVDALEVSLRDCVDLID